MDHRPRILLIEDNPGDVDLLRLAMKTAGFDCDLTVLDDGGEAIAMVRRQGKYADVSPPDLAILDLNVPKNDGIEIIESMRASDVFRDTQVVVLSSSSSPRDYAKLEKFHIARYITKPPDLDEFLNIGAQIKQLVNRPH
ncbi:MAG TPA: response regulator [Bryobacteraceae bacterium]|nr:response regulator [Bryobacteraceae bacterium]